MVECPRKGEATGSSPVSAVENETLTGSIACRPRKLVQVITHFKQEEVVIVQVLYFLDAMTGVSDLWDYKLAIQNFNRFMFECDFSFYVWRETVVKFNGTFWST